jgi:hypothetical protein
MDVKGIDFKGVDWIRFAQEGHYWWDFLNTEMNL